MKYADCLQGPTSILKYNLLLWPVGGNGLPFFVDTWLYE